MCEEFLISHSQELRDYVIFRGLATGADAVRLRVGPFVHALALHFERGVPTTLAKAGFDRA